MAFWSELRRRKTRKSFGSKYWIQKEIGGISCRRRRVRSSTCVESQVAGLSLRCSRLRFTHSIKNIYLIWLLLWSSLWNGWPNMQLWSSLWHPIYSTISAYSLRKRLPAHTRQGDEVRNPQGVEQPVQVLLTKSEVMDSLTHLKHTLARRG